jgi:hypothetical protein
LSKEQWAMARVYSFIDGNPKHDTDLRDTKHLKGGGLYKSGLKKLFHDFLHDLDRSVPNRSHSFEQRNAAVDVYNDARDALKELGSSKKGLVGRLFLIRDADIKQKKEDILDAAQADFFNILHPDPYENLMTNPLFIEEDTSSAERDAIQSRNTLLKKLDDSLKDFNNRFKKGEITDVRDIEKYVNVQSERDPTKFDKIRVTDPIYLQKIRDGKLMVDITTPEGSEFTYDRYYPYNSVKGLFDSALDQSNTIDQMARVEQVFGRQRIEDITPYISNIVQTDKSLKESHTGSGMIGGGISSQFQKQLHSIGLSPHKYLELIKKKAKHWGYDPSSIDFADDGIHKIEMTTPEGKVVRFGRIGYNDVLLWSVLEMHKKAKSGIANQKQQTFWKSHSKIKGNWKSNDYSPNWLSLRLLW